MPENDPQQAPTEDHEQDEEKLLEDLDPEEAEAAGVQGGKRAAGGRWHGRV